MAGRNSAAKILGKRARIEHDRWVEQDMPRIRRQLKGIWDRWLATGTYFDPWLVRPEPEAPGE